MKFEVGDIVGIRNDLSLEKYYSIHLSRSMVLNKGKMAKIICVDSHDGSYQLDIDDGQWWWSEDMLEPYTSKFTKSDLEDGDYCIFKNKTKAIKIGEYVVADGEGIPLKEYNDKLEHNYNSNYDILRVYRTTKYKIIYKNDEILDSTEKRYLAVVIAPFKDRIKSITKIDVGDKQYITIKQKESLSDGNIALPYFKSGTMYVGMESNKEYTLEELGL